MDEKLKQYQKNWRAKNKDKIRASAKAFYETESGKAYMKSYYAEYYQRMVATEEGREKIKRFRNTPQGREYYRNYNLVYNNTPEAKLYHLEYNRKYSKTEKSKAWRRQYYQKKKLLKQQEVDDNTGIKRLSENL
jgi:hypothetical protein